MLDFWPRVCWRCLRATGGLGARKGIRCVDYSESIRLASQPTFQAIPDKVDIKAMVEAVLEETGFREQRAAKMSVDDLLKYGPTSKTPPFTDI